MQILTTAIISFIQKGSLSTLLFFLCIVSAQAEVEYVIPLNAKEHKIGNMLEWSTSMEINSHNFIIEKSVDGIQFDNIGLLDAAGISGQEKSYRFLDMTVTDKKSFYRLKQVDLDGLYNYSQTVLLNREISNQFMVVAMSTTSFDKSFKITLDVITDVTMDFTITDLKGEVIKESKEEVTYGLNDVTFDLSDDPEGVYKIIIRLKDEEEMLVVQKINIEADGPENVASKKKQNGG